MLRLGLFQDDHPLGRLEGSYIKCVEIDATGNRLSKLIFAVPVGDVFPAEVAAGLLDTEIQLTY